MKIMIAGGGTGGHLFPALAIAGAIKEKSPESSICFVNGGTTLDRKVLSNSGFDYEIIDALPFRGRGAIQRVFSLFAVVKGYRKSVALLKKYKPDMILAVGGYSALPLGLAARSKKLPLMLQEQNAHMGMTNSILSKWAKVAFLGFPGPEKKIGREKCILTGNPIREEILSEARDVVRDNSKFTVLVWGGSQGARSINQSVMDALPFITRQKEDLYFIHQTGISQVEEVENAYKNAGFKARVSAFFEEPGKCYAACHAVICRAGASSLSEMMALGRTGLCVPYPHAAGDHQAKNARVLVNAGAMECMPDEDLNGLVVAEFIDRLRSNLALREKREAIAANMGKPGAARQIAAYCLDYMES